MDGYAATAPRPRIEGKSKPIRCDPSGGAERAVVEHWAEEKERSARVWRSAGLEVSYFSRIVALQSRAALGDGGRNCRDDQNLRAHRGADSAGVGRAAGGALTQTHVLRAALERAHRTRGGI